MRRILSYALLLLLAACRQGTTVVPTSAPPTIAPTPRSTALPTLERISPTGTEANPLRMIVVISDSTAQRQRAEDAALALTTAIEATSTGYVTDGFIQNPLVVEVHVAATQGEALDALCSAVTGTEVAVAWLDGLGFMAATQRGCATPALLVERGTGRSARTGEAFELLTTRELALTSVRATAGRDFCRLNYADFETWVAPALILRTSGVNPLDDLGTVTDYEDAEALYTALADGECDAAGIRVGQFDELDESIARDLRQIEDSQSPEFPYGVLLIPPEVGLGTRLVLDLVLLNIAEEQPELLEGLLAQDSLVVFEPEAALITNLQPGITLETTNSDLSALAAFLTDTGLNFGQEGG